MKNIFVFLLVSLFIISCNKDENQPGEILEKTTINGKWIVNNSSNYNSFEFNESGNYIIVKNSTQSTGDPIVLFGTYEIIDEKKIVVSDLGNLTISEINESLISFSIQLSTSPENLTVINATKKDEIESSTKTDLLCRTWKMVTENGEPIIGTEMQLTVLFSKAGTYFVSYSNSNNESDGGIAQWKWNDNSQTQLLYSWDEIPNWNEDFFVEILELNSNTLKITEDAHTWVLQPVSNITSARVGLSKKTQSTLHSGFFQQKNK